MTTAIENSTVNFLVPLKLLIRGFAYAGVVFCLLFILNNILIFWHDWPGTITFFSHYGLIEIKGKIIHLEGMDLIMGWVQFSIYLSSMIACFYYVFISSARTLHDESVVMNRLVSYIIRSSFWSILLIGIVDMSLSFLRVEGLLDDLFGQQLANDIGRASFRGVYFHYPLILIGFLIGLFNRSLGFIWLALLIVLAELLIVITRFVFSYEQAFMGDLVRFWYAGLFLFSSAYTLIEEGHVRVDILYSGFSERRKAWSNMIGSLFLGIPVCWIILIYGMWEKSNLINAPLLSYEVTQNGYGMFVKYLMAGFLIIYASSMFIQFIGYFLKNASIIFNEFSVKQSFQKK